ncbi:MAG TPA: hypothetical protein DD670_16605 [Planctomycetaceae bacterium]|nr:hypothetical protein [Planctomycetaceae bacterium]
MMKTRHLILAGVIMIVALLMLAAFGSPVRADDLAKIKPDVRTGFGNAGWNLDRYADLEPLHAGKTITLGDMKGPGVIRHIHMTRHRPKELFARGIVLEIWFDDADEPAVRCPVADFFGDGCNGNSMYFTSNLIECAPWSYNCYIPMPFAKRARVLFRNDTDRDAKCYAYVEWESLPEWDESLGYFHATYNRKCFQLTKETDEPFFEVKGKGHVLGRQFSVVTDEPLFKGYMYVMEGNNEINIDGRERQIDYLGTEDSFTFSWGFQNTFAGLRAGMPLVETGPLNQLSIYRFHDHMPIRFNKSLEWRINWSKERLFTRKPEWSEAVERDGCWVDYATVYYWYQNQPGGFKHQPLDPPAERQKTLLRSSRKSDKTEAES